MWFKKSWHSENLVIRKWYSFPKNLTLILWNRGSSLLNWWDKNMIEFLWNASFHKIFVYKESNIFQNKRTLQTEKPVSKRHGVERRFIRTAYFKRNPIPQHEFYILWNLYKTLLRQNKLTQAPNSMTIGFPKWTPEISD